MTPDPQGNRRRAKNPDNEVESMKPGLQSFVLVPLLAEPLAYVRQAKTPGERSKECVDDESGEIHASDAGGKSDEGADHGKKAACEHDDFAVFGEPPISKIDVSSGNEHVAAVFFY